MNEKAALPGGYETRDVINMAGFAGEVVEAFYNNLKREDIFKECPREIFKEIFNRVDSWVQNRLNETDVNDC